MRDQEAVSPVIGTLLILATFAIVVTTVIAVGRPQIVEYQERGEFQTVVNQMGRVVNEAKQMAVAGSLNEVRQPTLKIPKGDFQVGEGHYAAVSIGYIDDTYNDVAGDDTDPWQHPAVQVEPRPPATDWGRADSSVYVRWTTQGQLIDPVMFGQLQRWDGGQWETVAVGPPETMSTNDNFTPLQFQDENGAALTLADGPWRLQYYQTWLVLLPDVLAAEVYLYDQTQMTYRYSGEAGPRAAFAENGALFVYEHNQYRLVRSSLFAAPDGNAGGNALTVRAATLASDDGSASGRSELGFLMRVADSETWVSTAGAAVVRVQLSGPFESLWYKHLEDRGFIADADPDLGVYHVDDDTTSAKHTVFPVNLIYTELDMKVRQG